MVSISPAQARPRSLGSKCRFVVTTSLCAPRCTFSGATGRIHQRLTQAGWKKSLRVRELTTTPWHRYRSLRADQIPHVQNVTLASPCHYVAVRITLCYRANPSAPDSGKLGKMLKKGLGNRHQHLNINIRYYPRRADQIP
jgi:hypothetical protein